MPAQFHLESEHFQFCDASGPECLLADPGQCHQLFWENPSPQILFYSGGNAVNEEGYWEGNRVEDGRVTRAWRIWRLRLGPWFHCRLTKQPWASYSTFQPSCHWSKPSYPAGGEDRVRKVDVRALNKLKLSVSENLLHSASSYPKDRVVFYNQRREARPAGECRWS